MEENNQKFSVDTENLKNETVETAKKVKESIKGTNIKEETKATKGFLVEMFKNPIEKIKETATDITGKSLKTAIILLIIWTIILFIGSTYSTIYYWGFSKVFTKILSILKVILAPAIGIIVYSVTILVLNKENKKPLTTIISTVTITKIPEMLASIASLFTIISSNIKTITIPFENLCFVISIILGYFGFKNLFGEENDNKFIKKYVLIQAIYYVAYIIIKLLGIYI